jgi:thioredoxin 1
MSKVENLNEISFEQQVLLSSDNCLVEFGAEWCGPCKQQLPILENLANKYEQIKFYKVNIDQAPGAVSKFNIKSVPLLCLFSNGQLLFSKSGLTNQVNLEKLIKEKFSL